MTVCLDDNFLLVLETNALVNKSNEDHVSQIMAGVSLDVTVPWIYVILISKFITA
jgi:hypothetical protein